MAPSVRNTYGFWSPEGSKDIFSNLGFLPGSPLWGRDVPKVDGEIGKVEIRYSIVFQILLILLPAVSFRSKTEINLIVEVRSPELNAMSSR